MKDIILCLDIDEEKYIKNIAAEFGISIEQAIAEILVKNLGTKKDLTDIREYYKVVQN